jgi:hypothetical protein
MEMAFDSLTAKRYRETIVVVQHTAKMQVCCVPLDDPSEVSMASIFHYTDATGLAGILRSELLFASDYRFLNDTTEVGIIRDLALPVFEAEIAESIPKLIERKWLKGFYEFHGVSGHQLQAVGFFRTLLRLVNDV